MERREGAEIISRAWKENSNYSPRESERSANTIVVVDSRDYIFLGASARDKGFVASPLGRKIRADGIEREEVGVYR